MTEAEQHQFNQPEPEMPVSEPERSGQEAQETSEQSQPQQEPLEQETKTKIKTELGEYLEQRRRELEVLRAQLQDLQQDPMIGVEVLRRVDEVLGSEFLAVTLPEPLRKRMIFEDPQQWWLAEQGQFREEYLDLRQQYRQELIQANFEQRFRDWQEALARSRQEAADLAERLQKEKEKARQSLMRLKQEKSGLLNRLLKPQLLRQLEDLLQASQEQEAEDFIGQLRQSNLIQEQALFRQFDLLQSKKQSLEQHLASLQQKLAELQQQWQEKSAVIQARVQALLDQYEQFLNQGKELEHKELAAQEYMAKVVYAELGITPEDQAKYQPQTELEQKLSRQELERSFENARQMLLDYFAYLYRRTGRTPQETFKTFKSVLDQVRQTYRCEFNTSPDKLRAILERGRVASLWDLSESERLANVKTGFLGTAGGYLARRKQIEAEMQVDKPIYAALSTDNPHDNRWGPAPNYGDVVITAKPEVLNRARFVLGDSMNSHLSLISPFEPELGASKWHQLEQRKLILEHALLAKAVYDHFFAGGRPNSEHYGRGRELHDLLKYIEVHISNGLALNEIDKVRFIEQEPPPELRQALEAKGITVE